MKVEEAIKTRRSIRVFTPKPVPKEAIGEIIDCARLAPTARNEQPWEFVVITEKERIKTLANLTDHGKFIAGCPCCIAVFCQDTKYYLEDGSAATQNILLAAHGLGFAACWVAGDKKPYGDDVRNLLEVPQGFKLVSLIPLGYSESKIPTPQKKALKEVLHWERFGSR